MKRLIKLPVLLLTLILIFTMSGCTKKEDVKPDVNNEINNEIGNKADNTRTADEITDAPDANTTENQSGTDNNIEPDNSEDEGNFTFMNFIGCWLSETEDIAIVIDADHNWQACTKDEVFCTGYIEVEYGSIYLYTSRDNTYYCSLVYTDKAVTDEYGNVYIFDGPVEEYVPSGKVEVEPYQESMEYSLIRGKYYNDEDSRYYIEIFEDLNYEMYGLSDDGLSTVIDSGYLEKNGDSGLYTVHPTLYADEETYEIFEFDTGVLSWNENMYYYSEEEPDSNETAYTILSGTYFCLDEDSKDYYIVIDENLQYESYGHVEWTDELIVIDEGYITEEEWEGFYLMNSTMYDVDGTVEISVTEDGLLHWGLGVYQHGSDPAER